ncbi:MULTISPECIES: uridine diphosphate-N-acetylglucosamine-binding protein YvcK [Corynebacterium]|uniref:gluconeogenesis factor YvcK family protein n=1 Tax=Corynebacterium TaxID=1716 RepID=UPI00124BE16B|nr:MULTISPECIES: uridine diphosphate-N-acetylglucosamine-binding protein YvcK [Corynebacterium]
MSSQPAVITSLGGGHGLFQTLRAARLLATDSVNAVVTVADDGGSSGRIRKELNQVPPGDLRMALAALSARTEHGQLWEELLQHRFGGNGALAGHAVGNLLLAGLGEILDSPVAALDTVAQLVGCSGRVLPMVEEPLDIEADVAGLDDDPRIMHPVRGQVAVATTPGTVRRVRVIPEAPQVSEHAREAILGADIVTLGPGSWFSSVIPHLLVPGIVDAIAETKAQRIVVLNLTSEPGETAGFSIERHIHMLSQHAPRLQVDRIIIDADTPFTHNEKNYLIRAAQKLSAEIDFAPVRGRDEAGRYLDTHDPQRLATALEHAYAQR